MQQKIFKEKYHINEIELKKEEIKHSNVNEIIEDLKTKIVNHPIISFISVFDQYNHTKNLENGVINPEIKDAKNIVFCFGVELPTPEVLAVRPRSIGVCEFDDRFVVNFMEAPNENANTTMEGMIKSLRD